MHVLRVTKFPRVVRGGGGTLGAVVPLRCNISRDPGPRIYVSAKRLLPIPLFLGQPPPSLFLFRSIVIMETIILRSPSFRRFFVLTSTLSPSLPFHSSPLIPPSISQNSVRARHPLPLLSIYLSIYLSIHLSIYIRSSFSFSFPVMPAADFGG